MKQNHIATAATLIHASPARVWQALTDPELIRQYLFGTQVVTDWQPGSQIIYRGVWEGKPYEDKGRILEIEPEKWIVSTFWSALSGSPDRPEYYNTIRYELEPVEDATRITIIQDNNPTPEDASHSEQNWMFVLDGLKKLLEA